MTETTQFVRACALADVPDEGALGVEIDGVPVAVVRTGRPTGPPATEPVPVYAVKVEDGDVYVALGGTGPDGNQRSGEM